MPGAARAISTACATSASRSRPDTGRIWIVISRATSDCHSAAEESTSMTAPVVSEARNVMIATTTISARPAIASRGTIGVAARASRPGSGAGAIRLSARGLSNDRSVMALVVDMHAPLMQHKAPRVILIHQPDVVGGDHDRGARSVELDEQPQQPLRQRWVDVAGRLVRQQELWARDHGAGHPSAL